jgi:drug/metabolite transporter (DMT)-like permease
MNSKQVRSSFLLLLAAFIWGFAFVAQRKGMEHIHPLTFNGIRFLMGAITLIPLFFFQDRKHIKAELTDKRLWIHGFMAGFALFVAASFQQLGMMYTTAGKAGFITSLYILFVPAFGLITGKRAGGSVWLAAIVATAGLYFLSVHGSMQLSVGDMLVLISALFWAMHLIVLSYIAPLHDVRWIAFIQFLFTGLLSLILAFMFEAPAIESVSKVLLPLIYAGVVSAGIGFTLQIAGQKHARPEYAALILSLEAVFAAVGGFFILNERLSGMQLMGCVLMIFAVAWVQLKPSKKQK